MLPGDCGYGKDAHQWLLGNHVDRYIVGTEDMTRARLGDKTIEFITLGPVLTALSSRGRLGRR